MDLEDIIRFENEGTSLDFKAVQYKKETFDSLLKDILAMANATVDGIRRIVVGVKLRPDGSRAFLSIAENDFVDDAIYQQVVRENIEPEVHFRYFPFELDGHLLGVFEIDLCQDPPYMMQRDKNGLRKGDAWIRKGSHQDRLTRRDLDRLLDRKTQMQALVGNLRVGFGMDLQPMVELLPASLDDLPSVEARREIEQELSKRESKRASRRKELEEFSPTGNVALDAQTLAALINSVSFPSVSLPSMFGSLSYEHMSDEDLRKSLDNLAEDYKKDDEYHVLEVQSHKVQVFLLNEGTRYLEDAFFELKLPNLKGSYIPSRKATKPEPQSWIPRSPVIDPDSLQYPEIHHTKDVVSIRQHVGDIRHQILTPAFGVPFRMVVGQALAGETIQVTWTLHAKNLPLPLTGKLALHVPGIDP